MRLSTCERKEAVSEWHTAARCGARGKICITDAFFKQQVMIREHQLNEMI